MRNRRECRAPLRRDGLLVHSSKCIRVALHGVYRPGTLDGNITVGDKELTAAIEDEGRGRGRKQSHAWSLHPDQRVASTATRLSLLLSTSTSFSSLDLR